MGPYLQLVRKMAIRVAEIHKVLVSDRTRQAFAPEPFNDFYRQSLYHGYIGLTTRRLEFLRQRFSEMRPDVQVMASKVLDLEPEILAKFKEIFERRIHSVRTRFHGRLHLGHMLMTNDNVTIFDFEGDPGQHLSERRIKRCPIRDVASMLTSFGYAVQVASQLFQKASTTEVLTQHDLRMWNRFWYPHVTATFIEAYWKAAGNAAYMPESQADQETLLATYLLERAMLDVRPDIEDKPQFSGMPFRFILHLLNAEIGLSDRE